MSTEGTPAAIANAPGGLFKTLEMQLSAPYASQTAWFKRSTPTNPVTSLVGSVLLLIGGLASYCDFTQMVVALALLFPIGDLAGFMALAVVLLTLACGILLYEKGLSARWAAAFLFLVLTAFQAYVAYQRTVRTAEVQELVERAPDVSVAARASLTIDGAFVEQVPAGPTAAARVEPPAISQDGLLSAGLAVVLASAAAVAIWQGLDKAGWLVAWLAASPVWLIVSMPFGAVKLLNGSNWQKSLRAILKACLSSVRAAGVWLTALVQRLLRYCSAEAREARAVRKAKAKMRADHLRMARDLQNALFPTITQELGTIIELRQSEIAKTVADQFAIAMERVVRRAIEGAEEEELGDLPETLSALMTEYIRDIVARIAVNRGYARAKFHSPSD